MLTYYIFCLKWLWRNRQWSNTRQKFKQMERDYLLRKINKTKGGSTWKKRCSQHATHTKL